METEPTKTSERRCVTCGHRLDDPLECVNYLIWSGGVVPTNRDVIVLGIMNRTIAHPGGLVILDDPHA